MKAKYIIWPVVILLLCGGGYYWYISKKDMVVFPWKMAFASTGRLRVVVTATGTLAADTTVAVGTQVSGTISKILVDFNSKVKKNQIICVLDTTPLIASLEDARASYSKAQAALNEAKREYDRNKELLDQKVLSQSDFDLSLSNYESAKASIESAKAQLDKAKINLSYAIIKAPISGVIVSRSIDVGQTVAASFSTPTLFSIANDLTKMQVQANVDEADIGQIQIGQKVGFAVQAYRDRKFFGKVRQVRLQPTIISNVVNYTVIIDAPNEEDLLLPGMTATITFVIDQRDSVLKVPSAALKFLPPAEYFTAIKKDSINAIATPPKPAGGQHLRGGGDHGNWKDQGPQKQDTIGTVWIVHNNKLLEPRTVFIGLTNGVETEIRGNVLETDTLAVGVMKSKDDAQAQQNPFMPKMPGGNSNPRRGL